MAAEEYITLFVHPGHRRRGLGKMLLNAMESEYPGCRYELFTSTLSISNIRLYRSAGYAECGRKRISDMPEFVYLEKAGGRR